MIHFENVAKRYRNGLGAKVILDGASFDFVEGHNVGILGANGAGKSTLIRMIAGSESPDAGTIRRAARVSFPLGFTGTFHPHLSGRQNATFMARVYGESVRRVIDFVADFAELGHYFDLPIETYSAGMNAKLAFGVSLAIDFDVYLIDEITAVGDARFREKCASAFRERMTRCDIVMVSHSSATIRAYCDVGAFLADGQLRFFDTIDEAMRAYQRQMGTVDA